MADEYDVVGGFGEEDEAPTRPPPPPVDPHAEDDATVASAKKIRLAAERGDWRSATVMFDAYLQDNQRRFLALRHWSTEGDEVQSLKTVDPAVLANGLPDEPEAEVVANAVAIICGLASQATELAAELFDALDSTEQRATVRTALSLLVNRAGPA